MLSLKQYILEGSGEKVTVEWMKKMFEEFNKTLFNGALPKCELEATKLKNGCLGMFSFCEKISCEKPYGSRKYYMYFYKSNKRIANVMDARPKISMNNEGTFTDMLSMESTLIHEMIHYWTYKDCIAPAMAHGKEFKWMCEVLKHEGKKKYGKDFDLSVYADQARFTASDDVIEKEKARLLKNGVSIVIAKVNAPRFPDRIMFVKGNKADAFVKEILDFHKRQGTKVVKISCIRDATGLLDVATLKMYSMSMKYGKFYLPEDIEFYGKLMSYEGLEVVYDSENEVTEGKLRDLAKRMVEKVIRLVLGRGENLSLCGAEEAGKIEQTEEEDA